MRFTTSEDQAKNEIDTFFAIFKTKLTVLALTAELIDTQSDYFYAMIKFQVCLSNPSQIFKIDAMVTFLLAIVFNIRTWGGGGGGGWRTIGFPV